jgi:hypothetical protein
VQRLHRLLDWRLRVEAVDLQQVDALDIEARQAGVDLHQHGLARQPAAGTGVLGEKILVARTTSSRRVYFLSASPTICSEVPWP